MTHMSEDTAAEGPAEHYQVVVIGFGPSGAVAACLLGSHGLRTLAIDRLRDVYDKPRAIAIDHEIMRHLDNLGLAGRVKPHVAPFPASQHFGAQGQLIRRIDMVPEPYPQGYVPSMVFSQPPVEAAIRHHAASYSSVTVELGVEWVGLEQHEDGVALHLRGDDGRVRTVNADYVIACDGASSGIRQELGIGLDDLVFDEPWLVVDVLVGEDALSRLPPTAAQYCDPARPTSYIIGPGAHRRWEIMLLPGEDPQQMEQPEQVWRLLARWLTPSQATLWRAASYRFHALVAQEWRRGRVFLAGDAAHQQPPFIGQGMCQGLRDVTNLVWKLARVIEGRSGDALLDSYGEERGAHVAELTSRIKAIGHVICERDPVAAKARDARILGEGGGVARTITRQEIVPKLTRGLLALDQMASGTLFPQPWLRDGAGRVLMDTRHGAGWRLVIDGRGGFAPSAQALEDARSIPMKIITIVPDDDSAQGDGAAAHSQELDGVVARWFDTHACRAALIRPDHYVYGVAGDAASLTELTGRLLRQLRSQNHPRQTTAVTKHTLP
jgi:3-(3-hydroxy-phenyl)propionate hydroxylase